MSLSSIGNWAEQIPDEPQSAPVDILVVKDESGGWIIRVGETSTPPHASEGEAISEAMDGARQLAKAGFECRVVMRMLTCPFNPWGIGRAYPTKGRMPLRSRELGLLGNR